MNKLLSSIAIFAVISATSVFAESQDVEINGSVGKLSAVIQKPNLSPKQKVPMVLIFHGFTGSKNSVVAVNLANELEARGIASIRFDFNGHGNSEGDFQNMTVLNEIEDAKKIYEYVSKLDYVKSISIAGHSQGGVVASMMAGELGKKCIKAVVLQAPAAVLRDDAIRGNTMGATYDPLNPPEYVELPTRPEANGDMPAALRLGRDYITTAFSLPIYEVSANYKGPVCIIHGTGDRIVPYTYAERYAQTFKKSELHIIPGEDHMFSQDLGKVTKIAADFLEKKTK